MMRNFRIILWVFTGIILVFLIILFVELFKQDQFVYDNSDLISKPVIEGTDPYLGATDAKVVIVHFGDFENETSASIAASLNEIHNLFPNEVLIIWKDFPNDSLHPNSTLAAVAARCAQDQNAFWQYHDALFANQKSINDAFLQQIADELGLRSKKFARCLKRADTSLIKAGYNQALRLNLTAAPTIYINDVPYIGRLNKSQLTQIIRDLIEP